MEQGLEVKGSDNLREGLVDHTKDKSNKAQDFDITNVQTQAPVTKDSITSGKLNPSKSNKPEKSASSKGASARRAINGLKALKKLLDEYRVIARQWLNLKKKTFREGEELFLANSVFSSMPIFNMFVYKCPGSNQDRQQSIKELKEKADELKGVKEELKVSNVFTPMKRMRKEKTVMLPSMQTRSRILKDSKVGNGETASTCPVDDYMRVVRDALNAKRYEMDSVLPVINRMKNARSIDDMLMEYLYLDALWLIYE
ncbi:hypothetical protein GIB67_016230, partial [Kingdonia uniflora]